MQTEEAARHAQQKQTFHSSAFCFAAYCSDRFNSTLPIRPAATELVDALLSDHNVPRALV